MDTKKNELKDKKKSLFVRFLMRLANLCYRQQLKAHVKRQDYYSKCIDEINSLVADGKFHYEIIDDGKTLILKKS